MVASGQSHAPGVSVMQFGTYRVGDEPLSPCHLGL